MPEAPFEQTEHGRFPAGPGWFVLKLQEARWWKRGLGLEAGLSGRGDFWQLGVSVQVLAPGEPMAMYHWETDQEGFLVLSGTPLLIIEGEERQLRRWDFVHCPPGTKHVIVGAGDGNSVIFAVGARERHTFRSDAGELEGRDDWGAYTVDEAAIRHGAGVEEETRDAKVAYARVVEQLRNPEPLRYPDGLLPGFDR